MEWYWQGKTENHGQKVIPVHSKSHMDLIMSEAGTVRWEVDCHTHFVLNPYILVGSYVHFEEKWYAHQYINFEIYIHLYKFINFYQTTRRHSLKDIVMKPLCHLSVLLKLSFNQTNPLNFRILSHSDRCLLLFKEVDVVYAEKHRKTSRSVWGKFRVCE
jgi:hypothetical protein